MLRYFSQIINEARRKKVIDQIKENCDPNVSFYLMMGVSAIIVALGIVTNNTAVVIGAMLIAPIFWPIVGIALAIARGSVYSFKKSAIVLFKALAVAVVLILIFTLIYPLKDEPGIEVLSRSAPHLFDLFIALFAGLAGAFAIIWPGITSSLAGILAATTLMPAIGVIGYGISTWDYKIALGALLLFLTNLVAIIFSAFIAFFIFGFRPISTPKAKQFLTKELIWTIVLLLLIALPLSYSLYSTVITNQHEKNIKKVLMADIPGLKEADINSVEIIKNKNYLNVVATVQTKYELTSYEAKQIQDDIYLMINEPIKLKLKLIPVAEIEVY